MHRSRTLALGCVLAVSAACGGSDEQLEAEPNDAVASANPISGRAWVTGTVGVYRDTDVFQITAPSTRGTAYMLFDTTRVGEAITSPNQSVQFDVQVFPVTPPLAGQEALVRKVGVSEATFKVRPGETYTVRVLAGDLNPVGSVYQLMIWFP